jgi:methylmalonyl-CoA mutase
VNLLRNTVAVFAAGLGGAESITSLPFDSAIGLPDDFSRRIARNTVLILQEEAQLHRVIDQAGGSWFLDSLTEELADKAWEVFQQIERQGGMLKALQSGWAATQINSASVRRVKVSAGCKTVRAGISDLPDVGESPVTRAAPDARALREAAAGRITSSRRETKSLAAIAAQPDRTEAAVNAAAEGATIGQIARALGFHREPYEIQPLKLLSEAKPSGDVRNACGSERKEC